MVYIHVENDPSNMDVEGAVSELNKLMNTKESKTFMLVFMEGCGPCNATRPEWKKLQNVLSPEILKRDDIVIVSIDHILADKISLLNPKPSSFPTMKFISDHGRISENYEDSDITDKNRKIDSFVRWIESKLEGNELTQYKHKNHHDHGKHNNHRNHHSTAKHHNFYRGGRTKRRYVGKRGGKRGGKWSLKYKRSINCRKPRGFSQRQHCKYGRK